jgi:8-oxo-dGTP pyrophosphatase MutT (NUDIX family)
MTPVDPHPLSAPAPQAMPAATLVIVRDRPDDAPLLLMIERAQNMAFAGGALVFPGGRVDPGDHIVAVDPALVSANSIDRDEAAARIAAIRETIEEVGIATGFIDNPDAGTMSRLRAGLAQGRAFRELLQAERLRLDLDQLVPFARWRPARPVTRMFDTRFYLVAAPPGADAVADGTETTAARWNSAQGFLAEADAGTSSLIFPTRRNLERLAQHASHAALCDHALSFPVRTITPRMEKNEDGEWLCIPDDLGYPVNRERLISGMLA